MKMSFAVKIELREWLHSLNDGEGDRLFSQLDGRFAEAVIQQLNADWDETFAKAALVTAAWVHQSHQQGHLFANDEELHELLKTIKNPSGLERSIVELKNRFVEANKMNNEFPMVWDSDGAIYLRLFHHMENELAKLVVNRAVEFSSTVQTDFINSFLNQDQYVTDEQRLTIDHVLKNRLTLLTGGPGTGKTFTIRKIVEVMMALDPNHRIALLAPTGKAVARMQAVLQDFGDLENASVQVLTLHRFLASRGSGRKMIAVPRVDEPLDLVIVDECSMVDLQMMHQLLTEIPLHTHLMLAGDIHQLASVQPGSVFADLFAALGTLETQSEFTSRTVRLHRNFRFEEAKNLVRLNQQIHEGNAERAIEVLEHGEPDLSYWDLRDPETPSRVEAWIEAHYTKHVQCTDPREALSVLRQSMMLCATNRGPNGVEQMNRRIHQKCVSALRSSSTQKLLWLPLMVLENDYQLNLFNGDQGLIQEEVNWVDSSFKQCYFELADGRELRFSPHALSKSALAYALTVHKSQGSEADDVMVILPAELSKVLSRELFYTACSRARKRLVVVGNREVIRYCVENPVFRRSKLASRVISRFTPKSKP